MFYNFDPYTALITLPGTLLGFTFHEFAHAYTAVRFGDPTPERQGRLTINPLAHIDIWGLILIIFAGFGWAKPVQTNPSNYQGDIRKKDLIVSFAGPVANLVIAIIASIIAVALLRSGVYKSMDTNAVQVIFDILDRAIWINCVLFIFNLVPIPPLDGFHVLADLLPLESFDFIHMLHRYSNIILMIFIISPASDYVVGAGALFVYKAILTALGM
jgi:Zn-dependent protease